jgi:antitoxin component YwqK of YwqJK toxin-antitoxin module
MKKINQYDTEGRRHGAWEHCDQEGIPYQKMNYYHGNLHGIFEHFWSNGTLCWRRHYHHGEIKGIKKRWSMNGIITRKEYNLVIR